LRGIMQHIFNFEQCNTKDNVTYIMSKKFKKPLNKSCNPFQKTDLRSIITIVILVNILLFSLNIIGCKNVEKDPLTPQEREWLNKHDGKIIVNNEAGWPPIIDIDDKGNPFGIVMDYQKLIEKKLNFKLKLDKPDLWENFMERFKTGEIHVNNNLQKNPQREKFALFTEPYIKIPNAIFVRKENKTSLTLDEMTGMKIAVTHDFAIYEHIKKNYRSLQIEPHHNDEQCLLSVSTNIVDAAVVNLSVASYLIDQKGISNLKVAGYADYNNALCFASIKKWPILNQILQKGLDQITPAEKDTIYRKWISLGYLPFYKSKKFWIIIISATGIIVVFILFILLWNKTLRSQVQLRTEKLESINTKLEQEINEKIRTETALLESEEKWRNILINTPQIGISLDPDAKIIFANDHFLTLTGWTLPEVKNKNWFDLFIPEYVREELRTVFDTVMRQKDSLGFSTYENEILTKDGDVRSIAWANVVSKDPEGYVVDVTSLGVDLTERKIAEKALKESREFMQATLDGLPANIAVIDESGKILLVNRPWKNFAVSNGLNAEAASEGANYLNVCRNAKGADADCAVKFANGIVSVLSREIESFEMEYPCHSPTEKRWFIGRVALFQGKEPSCAVISHENITSRKLAEDGLKEREYKFRSLIESTKAIAWELELESFQFTYMSPRINDLTGYDASEWKDFNFWAQTLHPDDRERAVNFCQVETAQGKAHEFEYRIITANGETIWIRNFVTVIKENGKPSMLRGYLFDYTPFKHAEEEKLASEKKFLKAFNSAPVAMVIHESMDGQYLEGNDAFVSLTGFSREELSGKTASELGLISIDTLHSLTKTLQKDGRLEEVEIEILCSGKKKRTCLLSTEIIKVNGKDTLLSIVNDLTEQLEMKAQLYQAQKMESIGNLAGGIAHDFNNILFPIIGMSELLLEDLPKDSVQYENAEEILTAGKRGRELVKQILAFSRQMEQKKTPLRVQQILKEVLKLSRSTIPTNIELIQNIQQDCGVVMANSTQIHQIAMNLITNAYHAVMGNDGKIVVELKEMEINNGQLADSNLDPGRYARMSVSDNGTGMDSGIIKKIFEPYFTTKEKDKGTGLGLAVVYGIVKDHGGDIKVYSKPRKGTTVNVYLPLITKKEKNASEIKRLGLPQGNERILLVDDEVPILKLEQQILERLGYEVTARSSSWEAIEIFKVKPDYFDIVITDMNMPNMTGDQLAHEILSIKKNVPIIICTGFSENINEGQAPSIGVKGFLMKPVVQSELAQMIRKLLDGRDV